MTPAELKAIFRAETDDTERPYRLEEALLDAYVVDAQRVFCRWTDGISDASDPAVTEFAVVPQDGSELQELHPSILKIRACTRADNGRSVEVLNFEDLATRGWRYQGQPGPIRALVIGEERHKARVYPEPGEAVTLKLTVFRYPLENPIQCCEFEIDEEHHLHLLLWVKHKAYGREDSFGADAKKAADFEARFRDYCAAAAIEERRKAHKNRTVAYGGY